MRMLYAFMRAVTRVNEWVGRGIAWLILPMFVLLMAEVLMRYAFGAPAVWTGELTQLLFGVYAVLAAGYLLAHDAHARVDIVHDKLPPRARALVDVLTSILFFLFVGALLYFGSALAYESMETWERSRSAWNPPIWPVKLMVPVSAFLLLMQGVVKLARDLLALFGAAPPPAPGESRQAEKV